MYLASAFTQSHSQSVGPVDSGQRTADSGALILSLAPHLCPLAHLDGQSNPSNAL